MFTVTWRLLLLLGCASLPISHIQAQGSSGCASVRIELSQSETSCGSGSVSRPGKPIYAVNIDRSHAVHGVVIKYDPLSGFSHNIGPFDLAKPPNTNARHYIGCGKSSGDEFPYRCVKGTTAQ